MQIKVNGHNLNYEILNPQLLEPERTILVFLHDGLGSIKQWKKIPQKLCEALNLAGIVYDRFRYGASSADNFQFEPDYLKDEALTDLPGLLAGLKIKNKVILIGHSDGASIALLFASCYPDKLLGVISEAAHVFVEKITLKGIKKLQEDYQSDEFLSKKLRKYHNESTDHLFNAWSSFWLSVKFRTWNIEQLLETIKVPVLAIQGADDEYGSVLQLNAIKKNVSAVVTTYLLTDCGHFPHFEKEKEVLTLMKDFINLINKEQINNSQLNN